MAAKTLNSKQSYTMPRVYVVGGGVPYIRMFHRLGFLGAKHSHEADIICFTGGEDINPELYGEPALKGTNFNRARDERDIAAYAAASVSVTGFGGPVMIGICRGGQFLNVMNGGSMWQHVNNHGGTHPVIDYTYNEIFEVTSTHHQQMIPADKPETCVMAVAAQSTEKFSFGKDQFLTEEQLLENDRDPTDVEVIWYSDTNCLCFQPHPEIGHQPTFNYFQRIVDDWVLPALRNT